MDVPIISLIPPNGLELKEMTVELAVRIDHSVRKRAMPKGVETDITRTSFEVSFAPRAQEREGKRSSAGSSVDISMKFVSGDPPEGVSRVMEYYTNSLVPKLLDSGDPQSSTDNEPDPPPDGPDTGTTSRAAEEPPQDLKPWKDVPGTRTVGDPPAVFEVPEDDEDDQDVRPRFHGGGPESPEDPPEPLESPEAPEAPEASPEEPGGAVEPPTEGE